MTASRLWAERIFWGGLALLGLAYAVAVVPTFSIAYLDFGDGNYMYISSRMADGLALYRDILAPQPPLHLFVGTLLIRLGRVFSNNPETWLLFFRWFSLMLHLATMIIVALLARRIFSKLADNIIEEVTIALLAAFFYLVIPIGFWWTLAYESEALMLLFLLSGLLRMLRWDKRGLVEGGLSHLCAVLTNMTAAPYICWSMLFFMLVDRRRLLFYALPVIGGWLIVVGAFYLMQIDYLGNVIFNQTGTFAKKEILALSNVDGNAFTYAWGKIKSEGKDVFNFDFFFVVTGIIGLFIHLFWPKQTTEQPSKVAPENENNEPEDKEVSAPSLASFRFDRAFTCWFVFWTWMSLGFVSKGGTMDYIFTIGEPLLCAYAAFAVVFITSRLISGIIKRDYSQATAYGTASALIIVFAWLQIFGIVIFKGDTGRRYFGGQRMGINSLQQKMNPMELPASGVTIIKQLIEQHSQPGDPLLGPPFYAFISGRTLYEEYAEIYIWKMKYLNEKIVDKQDGEGVEKVEKIAAALNERRIPLALIDHQLWSTPELRNSLVANYRLISELPTMNTSLKIFIPEISR